jgi:hypothetical protein
MRLRRLRRNGAFGRLFALRWSGDWIRGRPRQAGLEMYLAMLADLGQQLDDMGQHLDLTGSG